MQKVSLFLSISVFIMTIVLGAEEERFINGAEVAKLASTAGKAALQSGLLGGSAADKEGCYACELVWR